MKARPASPGKKDKHFVSPDGRDFDRLVHALQHVLAQLAWARFSLSGSYELHSNKKQGFAFHDDVRESYVSATFEK